MPEVVSSHTNDEGEHATIERVTGGEFEGRLILVIHDDYPSQVRAPMLLDEGTIEWLKRQLVQPVEALSGRGAPRG